MLTQLSLKRFKSWPETGPIALAPITGFFGANSSGKSSLLQALLLLKQTAESADRGQPLHFADKASLVDLGDLKTVAWGHQAAEGIELDLQWKLDAPMTIRDATERSTAMIESDSLGFSARVVLANGAEASPRTRVESMAYRIGSAQFGMRWAKPTEYALIVEGEPFPLVREVGRPPTLPPPSKCYGFPDEVRGRYQNAAFLTDLELALERCLKGAYYLGPLRASPERQYPWSGAQPADMGRAGERAVDALLASRDRKSTIFRGRGRRRATLEEYVAEWLKKLGLIHEFRVEALAEDSQLYRVLVRRSPKADEVLITDVGFGVSQVLPVLVLCFYVPEGSTVILEQPEIHLHPSVQSGLADVFIDAWRTRRVQVIVESHSEHLLRRLRRRVAEEGASADQVALYFCEAEAGESKLTRLAMDMFGNIENWPADFFGDELGEMAAMTQAAQKRRRRAG
ncbi:MAG: DUF3696 domain-containing protein [Vicinamibacteria bacterium]|nr:DUF3696 domain-containing protein [Vicinamibacteria bacterium]